MPLFPVSPDNEERLNALHSYDILDTAEEKDFDELTILASAICQTPVALISLVDGNRQWFKAHTGTDFTETPIEQSFCAHAIINTADIMVVDDARIDQRFAQNPLVTGNPNIVFYAGVPLVNEDGFALGTLCVIDTEKRELSNEQSTALKVLAKQVVDKLELKRKMTALAKANQDLRDSNVFIQKFATMAAHDIKNPLSSILLTSQALKLRLLKLEDEGCSRLVDMNIASVKNLVNLVDDMLAYSKMPSLLIAKKQDRDMNYLLKKVLSLVNVPDNFTINIPEQTAQITLSEVAFEQIFINLLSNAIRYNDKQNGTINIRFAQDDNHYRFEVEDNGMGIADQYHEKVFQNNFTLKITDRYNEKGSGIGLSTVKELLNAMGGGIYLKSNLGEGTTFFITIKK